MNSLSFHSRSGAVKRSLAITAVALMALARPAYSCDPPTVVGLQTTFNVGEAGGSVSLTGYFQLPRATFSLTATALPLPQSASYRLVLVSPRESMDLGSFTVDETGAATTTWQLNVDVRALAIQADTLELRDDASLVTSTPVWTRAQIAFTALAQRGILTTSPRLLINGYVERRTTGFTRYDFQITGQKIPPGDYVLEFAGIAESFEIPFTSDSTRHVRFRFRGTDQDLLARSLIWTLARVWKGDQLLGTLRIDCRN